MGYIQEARENHVKKKVEEGMIAPSAFSSIPRWGLSPSPQFLPSIF